MVKTTGGGRLWNEGKTFKWANGLFAGETVVSYRERNQFHMMEHITLGTFIIVTIIMT